MKQLNEIIEGINSLRENALSLADASYKLHCETNNPHVESVAQFLHYELTTIACRLSDLAETETEEDFTPSENEDESIAETIEDWWDELSNEDKSEISNIPRPTYYDGRGESDCEFEDRTRLWWNSRTYDQKKEIYNEWGETLGWWEKED